MNKEHDIDNQLYKYLSPDLYCYVHNYIVDLKNANNQLTNNWNELEEFILNHYIVGHTIQNASLDAILNKMKELKENNK